MGALFFAYSRGTGNTKQRKKLKQSSFAYCFPIRATEKEEGKGEEIALSLLSSEPGLRGCRIAADILFLCPGAFAG